MKQQVDIAYGEHPMQMLDMYLPESECRATFVYFHGGGLKNGSRKGFDIFATDLADVGIATVSVEYRMYPEAKFPDFIDDAARAVAFVKANAEEYGLSDKMFVGGSSAGGYLSMMLCFDDRYFEKYGVARENIAGYIHDAGQPTTHFHVLTERGIDSRRLIVDEASPLFFVGTKETYAPMLIINAECDMQNRIEQTYLLISTLRHFGFTNVEHIIVPNTKHCQYISMQDEEGKSIFATHIRAFIEKQF